MLFSRCSKGWRAKFNRGFKTQVCSALYPKEVDLKNAIKRFNEDNEGWRMIQIFPITYDQFWG